MEKSDCDQSRSNSAPWKLKHSSSTYKFQNTWIPASFYIKGIVWSFMKVKRKENGLKIKVKTKSTVSLIYWLKVIKEMFLHEERNAGRETIMTSSSFFIFKCSLYHIGSYLFLSIMRFFAVKIVIMWEWTRAQANLICTLSSCQARTYSKHILVTRSKSMVLTTPCFEKPCVPINHSSSSMQQFCETVSKDLENCS